MEDNQQVHPLHSAPGWYVPPRWGKEPPCARSFRMKPIGGWPSWQLPSPSTPRLQSPEHVPTLRGAALRIVENRVVKQLSREEAGYWLGMAMHRQYPRRVLAALRTLLTIPLK